MAIGDILKKTGEEREQEEKELDEKINSHLAKSEDELKIMVTQSGDFNVEYGIRALYESNKAIIELLKEIYKRI
ncbi:hypothetical protein JW756_03855 [Candidatus Woesearchaeota archaeon]|nr:hypothetical protein [Candidatus Woesearchaeota archaeon]